MASRSSLRSSGADAPRGKRPPIDPANRRRVEAVAYWLDERFRIPGTGIRVGLDGLIGLIPGVGDTAATLISLYLVAEGWRLGLPKSALARMLGNVALDFLVGSIPVLGDVFDVAFKANRRNLRLLLGHLDTAPDSRRFA